MIQSLSLLKYIIKEDEEEMKPRHVPSSNSTEYFKTTRIWQSNAWELELSGLRVRLEVEVRKLRLV